MKSKDPRGLTGTREHPLGPTGTHEDQQDSLRHKKFSTLLKNVQYKLRLYHTFIVNKLNL